VFGDLDFPASRWESILKPWSSTMHPSYFERESEVSTFGWMHTIEKDNGDVVVSVDLPGVKKEDVSISAEHGVLTVHGIRRFASSQKGGTSGEQNGGMKDEMNVSTSEVKRSFTVPKAYDVDNIQAHLEEGVLTLTLPKIAKEEKAKKQILVQ